MFSLCTIICHSLHCLIIFVPLIKNLSKSFKSFYDTLSLEILKLRDGSVSGTGTCEIGSGTGTGGIWNGVCGYNGGCQCEYTYYQIEFKKESCISFKEEWR